MASRMASSMASNLLLPQQNAPEIAEEIAAMDRENLLRALPYDTPPTLRGASASGSQPGRGEIDFVDFSRPRRAINTRQCAQPCL